MIRPMQRPAIGFALCLVFTLAFSLPALGQGPGRVAPITQMAPQQPTFGSAVATVTVIAADEHGANLGEQALVKLTSDMNGTDLWGTTQDRSQIMFDDVAPNDYQVEVSAAGYETATQEVNVVFANQNYDVLVRLKRDPSSAVVIPLPGQVLRGKARKMAQKAIAALTAGKLNEAQKDLNKAYKASPGNADVNYLFGVLYSRKNDTSEAESYLKRAVSINTHHVRALAMLGELQLRQKNYKQAIASLQQAVSSDSGFWIAHWLLATAYLNSGAFQDAVQQAQLAIQTGKGAGTPAELILGEALANLGKNEQAIQAFQAFLQQDPHSPSAQGVRNVIAQLKGAENPKYKTVSASRETAAPASVLPAAILTSSPDAGLSIPTWHPAGVDEEKLTLAAGAVCPAQRVIQGAGRSAERLVDDVSRFEATELMTDEELNVLGQPEQRTTLKFDYMATISKGEGGGLAVDEDRVSFSDRSSFPDHIVTRGLAALALVFDPVLRVNYDMTCEGLGAWKGKATWLVYFRQRPDRPDTFMRYAFTNADYAVALKGRAWILADNYQIVHLEADLLNPLRQIQLLRQHQSVDYAPVAFKSKKTVLWLPKSADLYFNFRRRLYYRHESFEKYKLFSVGASEKISQPKIPDVAEKNLPPKHRAVER